MKNIWRVFFSDFKRVSTNVVAIVIMLGLAIIPALYAWFNILSNWDPYGEGATSQMKISVYSEDEGFTYGKLSLNVGDSVVEGLKANTTIGWVFSDSKEEALEGVYSGEYYASLIIPKDFTEDMISFIGGNLEHPTIQYYENSKKNAIATKITGKAKTAVQQQVNTTFLSTIAKVTASAGETLSGEEGGISVLDQTLEKLEETRTTLNTNISILQSFAVLTNSTGDLLGSTQSMLPSINNVIDSSQNVIANSQNAVSAGAEVVDGTKKLLDNSIDNALSQLNDLSKTMDRLSDLADGSAISSQLPSVEAVTTIMNSVVELLPDSNTQNGNNFEDRLPTENPPIDGILTDEQKDNINNIISSGEEEANKVKDEINKGLEENSTEVEAVKTDMKNLTDSYAALVAAVSTGEKHVGDLQKDVNEQIRNCTKSLTNLKATYDNGLSPQLNNSVDNVQSALSSTYYLLNSIDGSFSEVNAALTSYEDTLTKGTDNINQTVEYLIAVRDAMDKVIEGLEAINNDEQYQDIVEMLSTDPEMISEFISSPVKLEKEAIYEIEGYGSAMTPFYTVLALWVGALISVALVHVNVENEGEIENLRPYQAFFGRFITFFILTQSQALITVLGNLFFVQIQCKHPFLFWLAAFVTSFTFSMLMYALTVAFGNVGQAIAVVIMVIQVAGAGGTFPIEVLPKVYQMIYKFLPFPYAMNAMRECVGGTYKFDYAKDLAILGVYVAVSIFIGLVVAIPFRGMNKKIEKSKERSKVML